jgi:hypothetical protein
LFWKKPPYFQAISTQKYLTNTLITPTNLLNNSKYLKNDPKSQNQTDLVLDLAYIWFSCNIEALNNLHKAPFIS